MVKNGVPLHLLLRDGKSGLKWPEGTDAQWYKNVLQNPSIRIDAPGVGAEFRAIPVTDATKVQTVVANSARSRAKDVKKYYSKLDVAVVTN